MRWTRFAMLLLPALSVAAGTENESLTTTINAAAFGVAADGVTDDGPAIERMLDAAGKATGPVALRFPSAKTIRVESAKNRYVFRFDQASGVTLDGNGCTFLLGPDVRFLTLTRCQDVVLKSFSVDFSPLPFADGDVVSVHPETRALEVRVADADAARVLGGPTHTDGEQSFFSMLWHGGPYGLISRHYWTERIEPGDRPDLVRVFAGDSFRFSEDLNHGVWRVSLPVPGIAHRYGPGPCFRLQDNNTVAVEDVELWSAPWFGFEVTRNTGAVTFRRVHIRPKPGSGRLTSLWRDGFHVKGNRARLLWEECHVAATNDDAFNISTHSSLVKALETPTRITVQQKFPLTPMPWRVGDTVAAADEAARRLLGSARIVRVEPGPEPPRIQGKPAAPPYTLELEQPVQGLAVGSMVWCPQSSNPDTTLRRCRIETSCRLQSPVTLDACDVTALLWFYGEHVEGPFPSHVRIKDCVIRRGRGNPVQALVFAGSHQAGADSADAATPPRAIHDVRLRNNVIWGGFSMEGVEDAVLEGNWFKEQGAPIVLRGNHAVTLNGNTVADGEALAP